MEQQDADRAAIGRPTYELIRDAVIEISRDAQYSHKGEQLAGQCEYIQGLVDRLSSENEDYEVTKVQLERSQSRVERLKAANEKGLALIEALIEMRRAIDEE